MGAATAASAAGNAFCPICRGGGELTVSQLSPYQLTHYPKLSQ